MFNYKQQKNWNNNFGNQQSPINIKSNKAIQNSQNISFIISDHYRLSHLIDDRTTIRLTGMGHSTIFNRPFEFQQVHFHAPAEHLIDDYQFPFEIHLVHQNAIGQLLVTALMVQLGEPDSQFEMILDHFAPGTTNDVDIDITNWIDFSDKKGFHYLGSLTTPPLTEGVEWLVVTNSKLTISPEQLNHYQQLFDANARDVQPLAGRSIYQFN
ncbi:carbonic anhydrase family protein [Lactobacillaceae bacterium Melli_B4]